MTVLLRDLVVPFDRDPAQLAGIVARRLRIPLARIRELRLVKRSLDSRGGRKPRYHYNLALELEGGLEESLLARQRPLVARYREPEPVGFATLPGPLPGARPVVVGAGPAGLFAALRLAQGHAPPVVMERGPDVTERSKRWARFLRGGEFDPESNLLFGEGGAGAYSDGKLYTRVSDPRGAEVIQVLVAAGAPEDILYDAHPHVGSNLLPSIVRRLRQRLIELGVEFRFETRFEELALEPDAAGRLAVAGVALSGSETRATDAVFLALGHSARDTYRVLERQGVAMVPKPFQMGVRVEHPQEVIDRIQYGDSAGHPLLPPAEYRWVDRSAATDVFSFCMCPGGEILPATERPGFICTNGASRHRRRSPFATSGFVVTVEAERFAIPGRPLAGVELQERTESRAAELVELPFAAPALRFEDFLAGRVSAELPQSSYPLRLVPAPFGEILPDHVLEPVREGLAHLAERYRPLRCADALVVAPESRSSSPVRLERDGVTFESTSTPGLYPIGEGAGFAGGILSAAIDGLRAAEAWLDSRCRRQQEPPG